MENNKVLEKTITCLYRQIKLCDELKGLEREKWVFIQVIEKIKKLKNNEKIKNTTGNPGL